VSSWRDHSPEFVDVREYDDGRPIVVMELQPTDADVLHAAWDELRAAWLDLPAHPNMLDAIRRTGRSLLVRFAAIDWRRVPLLVGTGPASDELGAAWGVQLCQVYEHLARCLTPGRLRFFVRPMIHVDIDGRLRVGFLPPSPYHRGVASFMAPEARNEHPIDDENVLVFLVGTAMAELTRPRLLATPNATGQPTAAALPSVIDRCRQEDPAARFQTLREARRAFRHAGPVRNTTRTPDELAAFAKLEEELGWRVVRPSPSPLSEAERAAATISIARHIAWADHPQPPREPPPPGSPRAIYLEGKELFRAGRLDDARAAFERALALDPRMIEAMLLRREVDRLAGATRAAAGHQYASTADLDESLAKSARLEAQLAHLDADADAEPGRS
jgi:hypothetical protein